MSTTPLAPDALTDALIDDAALFPPGNAPMVDAVPAHACHLAAWYSRVVGPFLCPASRLDEMFALLDKREPVTPLDVALIVDTGTGGVGEAVDAVALDDRTTLRGVELPLRGEPLDEAARRAVTALDAALGGPDDPEPAFVELPRIPGWRSALEVVADSGYRAKLRTGGLEAHMFPSEAEVADFALACLDLGVPFKLTAGLHHPVRHTAPGTGFEHHGFLNVLMAVRAALDGAAHDDVVRVLAERDSSVLADQARALTAERALAIRRWFTSYGTCDIDEPVEDLVALGLISKE